MFVRIQRWTPESLKQRQSLGDAIYECARIFVRPVKDKPDEANVVMEGSGLIELIVDKRTCDVFVMNNDGRTIDSYRWSERYA